MKTRILNSMLLATTSALIAFDNKKGWKLTADGKGVELNANGQPIYINDQGQEAAFDFDALTRVNAEAANLRRAKETAEASLKKFEKITDPEAALRAIETVGKLDQKKLIDAGEVDRVRSEISEQFKAQIDEVKKTNAELKARNDGMALKNAFQSSKFVSERIAVPMEMFMGTFGKHFKVEGDEVYPVDASGHRMLSTKTIGSNAGFDEAIETFVGNYAYKDTILKAKPAGGSGNNGAGGGSGNGRVMKLSEFNALTPVDKAAAAAKAGRGEITISDAE